jgi:hypothetical protein
VNGKTLSGRFDGGASTSHAGLLALREVERRLAGARDFSSQSTLSRLENLPDRRMLLRLARAPRLAYRIDRLLTIDAGRR